MTTAVFVHAHPDDEALLTGGTMRALADRGHRVVLVVATDGARGLASDGLVRDGRLSTVRAAELSRSARILGCDRVVNLGFADSGSLAEPAAGGFATLPSADVSDALARVLVEEHADVVFGYDPAGGYGHRDHVRVHEMVRAAAAAAGTPRVLEATVRRETLQRALVLTRPFTRGSADFRPARFDRLYSSAAEITHCQRVGAQAQAKRAAMLAHASQATADDQVRALRRFLDLPEPLFRLVFGREWFVEVGAAVPRRPLPDVLTPAVPAS